LTRFKFRLKKYRWRRKENSEEANVRHGYPIIRIPIRSSIRHDDRMHGMQPDWPHYHFRLEKSEAQAAIRSDVVKDDTHLPAANDDMDLDNSRSKPKVMGVVSPNDEYEEGEFKVKKYDNVLCVHGNNTDKQVSILQLLDTGESSVGAQHQRIIRDKEDGEKLCAMDNNIMQLSQSSTLTAPAVDRGVKPPSPAKANNCLTVCRCEEVIMRCDSDQMPTRCTSSAGQCSNAFGYTPVGHASSGNYRRLVNEMSAVTTRQRHRWKFRGMAQKSQETPCNT